MRLIITLLVACAVAAAQTATFTKINNGGATAVDGSVPGFESWDYGAAKYSSVLGKVVVPMRADAVTSIYTNGWWAINGTTGAFTFIGYFNSGHGSQQCSPGGATPWDRHLYGGTAIVGSSLFFGGGACGSVFKDLNSLNVSTGVITSKTVGGTFASLSEHAFASDGTKIYMYGGNHGGGQTAGTWTYDSNNDAAGFVAQHPTTCTDSIGSLCTSGGVDACSASDTSCPPPVYGHAMDYDEVNGVYVVFGGYAGYSGAAVTKSTWAYNPSTKAWTRKADFPGTQAQYHPLFVYHAGIGKFVLYAGNGTDTTGLVYTFDYASNTWASVSTNISGPVLYGTSDGVSATIAYDRNVGKIVMATAYASGAGNGNTSPQVWTLDIPFTSLEVIGKGCTTAYYIDKDCDGYGVAKRADGNYTTTGNYGNLPDADDNNASVNTAASVISAYGSISAFLTAKGYPTSRIWYVSTTGNNTTCSTGGNYTTVPGDNVNFPCANMGPMATAWNDGAGATVLWRGGTYSIGIGSPGSPYPNYKPQATSSSSPLVVMSYPGEVARVNASPLLDTANWPTGVTNVIVDGFIQTGWSGDCVNQDGTTGQIFRNNEIVGCADGIRETDHTNNLLIDNNVFHDNTSHAVYLGYSSPEGQTHVLGADFDFTQDAINYTCTSNPTVNPTLISSTYCDANATGISNGANQYNTVTNNVSYRDGNGGFESLHMNAYINYLTVENNIVHASGGTGLGFQTGIYNAVVRNNVLWNNGGCGITFSQYGGDVQASTHRYNSIVNNTIWMSVVTSSYPTCGIYFTDNTDNSGTMSVTNGSASVVFVDGARFSKYWPAGKSLTINGVTYHVSSVTDTQHMTLQETYAGSTSASVAWSSPTTDGDHWMKDFTIRNNVIATVDGNPGGSGSVEVSNQPIKFGRSSYPATHTITNNLFWSTTSSWNNTTYPVATQYSTSTPGSTPTGGTGVTTSGGVAEWRYNLSQFQTYHSATNSTGDPLFAAANSANNASPWLFDFSLTTGSPAINFGTTTGAPSTDILGVTRGTPDAGAYEVAGNVVIGGSRMGGALKTGGKSAIR